MCRLRELMAKIRNEDVSKEVLLSNLDYVAKVLENTYVKETRSTVTILSTTEIYDESDNIY